MLVWATYATSTLESASHLRLSGCQEGGKREVKLATDSDCDTDASPRELVIRALRRDAAAFSSLIGRYERTALAVAYATLGDASAAGDVVQDAFLRAWQRLGELKEPERFGAWLSRMVRNLAIDARRKRPMPLGAAEEIDRTADGHDPSRNLDHDEMRLQVDAALASLDDTTRSAVVLRYYDNLPSKQIGELLGLSPAAVDMRLSRGRAELKEKLAWADPTAREAL